MVTKHSLVVTGPSSNSLFGVNYRTYSNTNHSKTVLDTLLFRTQRSASMMTAAMQKMLSETQQPPVMDLKVVFMNVVFENGLCHYFT